MKFPIKASLTLLLTAAMGMDRPSIRAEGFVLITEFMAANDHTIKDDLGEFSDWIEIYNSGTNTVNLGGYYLTDELANLSKWQFPATNLPPRRYLVVYASGFNRVKPGQPLHTNFKLNADGEYLALIKPDGVTVISEFAPVFPPQEEGLSYGLAVDDVSTFSLVVPGADARVLIPTNNIATAWIQPGFDDTAWFKAKTAIKFDQNSGSLSYDNVSGTDIEARMLGTNASACIRIPFAGVDPSKVNDLQLFMRYDDGFVAYLNGHEIARRLAPATLQWNSTAINQHSNVLALVSERISLNESLDALKSGENVLAIQGLNRGVNDTDFLILPEIVAREVKVLTNVTDRGCYESFQKLV